MKFRFDAPLWLWITAALLAGFVALLWISARARRRQFAAFADPGLLEKLLLSHSRLRRILKNSLLFLAILGAGLALARPQWGFVQEEIKRQGEDVVFVLDLSKSMLAQDANPTRLERAKLAILDFVHRQKGGRVGFVVFSGSAFPRVPLTLDYDAFEENVRDASPEDLFYPGSDVARALIAGKNAFDKSDRRRVLILLSDGEDLEGNGIKVAEELTKEGVVVFSIGIGTASGSQIMVPTSSGRPGPLLDDAGRPVVSKLDEDTLRAIAAATGGRYYRLDTIGGTMGEILRLLRVDPNKGGIGSISRRGVDQYAWPLAVCIFLLVVESLLAARRRQQRQPAT
jgi:Ca-activated chloride channel homolog